LAQRGRLRRPRPPNLFFGITAGNMDSMVNRYTADRRVRSDDAYTPGVSVPAAGPLVIVYAQRAREAFGEVPIVIGGIEASLRRIAHFDYWSEKVRRSVLLDAKATCWCTQRRAADLRARSPPGGRESIRDITDLRARCSRAAASRRTGSRLIPLTWMRPGR